MAGKFPETLWHRLRQQTDEALGREFWEEISGLLPNIAPKSDIYHRGRDVVVVIELPGVTDLQGIALRLKKSALLMIEGAIPSDYPEKEEDHYLQERYLGEFSRRLTLPCEVFADPLEAELAHGLLKLVFRKKPPQEEEEIRVAQQGEADAAGAAESESPNDSGEDER